jgi:subtilisin family serine protease
MTYIVQADTIDAATFAVEQAGGTVTDQLTIINGVVAALDHTALAQLRHTPRVAIHPNRSVRVADDGGCGGDDDDETGTSGCALYPSAATAAYVMHEQYVATPKTECKNQRVIVSGAQEQRPLQGRGVTVAVIDSGFIELARSSDWQHKDPATGTLIAESAGRCIIYRDFLPRDAANDNNYSSLTSYNSTDQNGHGTHVVATIADSRRAILSPTIGTKSVGVAPQVNLLIARALDKDGAGAYGEVIKAIDWIVTNKDQYNVRVLNLSLYAPVVGPYWTDPLNQAVMKAWEAGIVVVVAAGNEGSKPGTITAPGNVPYVITVGAIESGRYTESGSDELATYSGRGPTESAFVKPDVIVPASRTIAPMPGDSTLATKIDDIHKKNSRKCPVVGDDEDEGNSSTDNYPSYCYHEPAQVAFNIVSPARNHAYYQLSGTSMAAAEVSGIAALILQNNPQLTNDEVKYRLMATARIAIDEKTGEAIYSIWEQGAGLIDAYEAVYADITGEANVGMDINLDLTSDTHYWGQTTWDEAAQEFRLTDSETGQTYTWKGDHTEWDHDKLAWNSGRYSWAGGRYSWAGGRYSWAGGVNTWTSNDSFWAGAHRSWAGSTPITSLATASQADILFDDDEPQAVFTISVPLVVR